MTRSGTASDNECQRVTIPANFSFFFKIKEEPTTKHPKENFLNLEEDLWRRFCNILLRIDLSITKWSNTLRQFVGKLSTNCLSVFDRFVGLALKGLKRYSNTGVFPCWSLFLRKLQVLKPANLLEGDSNTGVFRWILRNF